MASVWFGFFTKEREEEKEKCEDLETKINISDFRVGMAHSGNNVETWL